jgi:hypothetical protein
VARVVTTETIAPVVVGYANALTTQSIETTRVTGLQASDGSQLDAIDLTWNRSIKLTQS